MQSLDQEMNEEELTEATDEERREKHTNPFSPPQDISPTLPLDHPSFDEDQTEEAYDEGMNGASGVYDQEERALVGEGKAIR